MRPAFAPGDRLYVDPRPTRPLDVGDVVVLRDPERTDRLLLKRVVRLVRDDASGAGPPTSERAYVEGDNLAASRDSRHFGPVPLGRCVGVVWFRYAPPERRGPVPDRSFK